MKMMIESGSIIANGPAQKKNIDKVGRVLNSIYRVPVSFRLLVGPLIKFFVPETGFWVRILHIPINQLVS
jgi:hypothetical protein